MAEICPFMVCDGDRFCYDGYPSYAEYPGAHTCKAWGVVRVEKVVASTGYIDIPKYGCKLIERQ